MGLLQRLGDAVRGFRGEYKEAPFRFPAWVNGQPLWQTVDIRTYIEEGFNINTIIYESIMYKARSITLAPLRAYTGSRDKPKIMPDLSPLSVLLARPNEFQSQMEFMSLNVVYLNVTGNVFIYLDREGRVSGLPSAMYSLRPDRVYIVPRDNRVFGYLYVPEGKSFNDAVPLLAKDVIHVKFPNPADRLDGMGYGLSPISAAARMTDVDNSVSRFLKLFFDRGMVLGGVLKFPQAIDDKIMNRVKQNWKEMYGGVENWATEIGVLDQGATYERITPTFDQMGFGAIDERTESRITGPFGVPPILIGTRLGLMRSTYANYDAARKACWEDTLTYEINLFETEFQHYLFGTGGDGFVAADTSKVPALQKNVPELINAGKTLIDVGVPPNIAFKTVGLDIEQLEFGDVSFMAAGYQLTESVINPPAPPTIPGLLAPNKPAPQLGAGDEDDEEMGGEQAQTAAKKFVDYPTMLRQSRNGKRPTTSA